MAPEPTLYVKTHDFKTNEQPDSLNTTVENVDEHDDIERSALSDNSVLSPDCHKIKLKPHYEGQKRKTIQEIALRSRQASIIKNQSSR